ncbi:MAG: DUF3095 domain-containing protein [Ignavibacteriales bacterium]|nr:DUF3095 domain-containing protein [Ignavibacteriales bacterium]
MPNTVMQSFYTSVPPVQKFEALADPRNYSSLPSDWAMVVADVMNSTAAIQKGDYKAVNTVGVSVIAAILNTLRPLEVPYIFGGDGALVCIPERFSDQIKPALSATLAMAVRSFGLILRAAIVPAAFIRARGFDILVARHQVSEHYVQGAISGGGVELVESMLKDGALPADFVVTPDADASADYSGLECRWQEIRSPRGETVAIIVRSTAAHPQSLATYEAVIKTIGSIYGDDERCKPVTEGAVRAALSYRVLQNELRLKHWKQSVIRVFWHSIVLRAAVILGWFLMQFEVRFKDTDWGIYKKDLVANSDFRKFDGALRFVLSGNTRQREQLRQYLMWLEERGEVNFGIHVADSAIITCLVQEREKVHFHFIDASGGGYAAAALALKTAAG